MKKLYIYVLISFLSTHHGYVMANCWKLLHFITQRSADVLDPEELMRQYLECAEKYPRDAEEGLYAIVAGMVAFKESQKALRKLKENKFKFSELFREAMRLEIAHNLGNIIYPILLSKQAQGFSLENPKNPEQSAMRDVYFQIDKDRPNCNQLAEFMSTYAHDKPWVAQRVKDLCEMQNLLAPDLMPR